MAKPKVLKPYVKSAVKGKSNWRVLEDLSDLKTLVTSENLARKTSRGIKRRLKAEAKAGTSSESVKEEEEQKIEDDSKAKIFIGMRSALRKLNENAIGAFIIDESVVGPSAVAQVFNLMSCSKACDFYKAKGLSKELSGILNMPRASVIAIGKDEPIIIQLKLSTEPKAEPEKPTTKFVQPQFKYPIGKKKSKKNKK